MHDRIIMFRIMGISTLTAVLDLSAAFFNIRRASQTMLQPIHGAIAEQAVKIRKSIVTGEIFAISIFKKTIGIFHF